MLFRLTEAAQLTTDTRLTDTWRVRNQRYCKTALLQIENQGPVIDPTHIQEHQVSKDIAASENGSLIGTMLGELAKTKIYKPTQGRIVRQLTALAIWVIVGLGCWSLHGTLRGSGSFAEMQWVEKGIPFLLLLFGAWFGFRVVNLASFADFLIAVEAEMNKVTWPSKDELVRAAIVVIFTIFFLAISLFLFDILWQKIFSILGVTA